MSNKSKFRRAYLFSKVLRKYHFIIVTVIIILIFTADSIFLYRYFYQGLTESRLVLELKQETLLEKLDLKTYTELREFNEKRQKSIPLPWDTLRDPFEGLPTTSSSGLGPP